MKVLRLLSIASIILFYTYAIAGKQAPDNIAKIKVTINFPLKYPDNHSEIVDIAFYVYYYKGYEIYELPYHETSEINGRFIYDSLKYEYFIHKAFSNFGINIKTLKDSLGAKKDISTILNQRAWQNINIMDSFKMMKIKKEYEVKTDSSIVQLFELDNQYYDSAQFFYDKNLNDIRFTFSGTLDSIKRAKLSKIQYYFKDLSTVTYQMARVKITNEQDLKNLFDRFIKQEN